MNKFFKRTVVTLLAAVCAFSSMGLAACGDTPDDSNKNNVIDQKYDPNMAQLYVSNFNGGVGSEWLYNVIERFQKEYADVKFTDNTTGVQVWVENHKVSGEGVAEKMQIEKNQVYFLGTSNYRDMVATGKLYDMTKLVTETLSDVGENVSIESKMSEDYQNYYGLGSGENKKYYAIPHYDWFSTITYDVDLFDEKTLFFDTQGNLTKTSSDEGRGTGPDGVAGTYDDGLPRTYAEFFKLCETMKVRGVDPIVWSGMYNFYTTEMMAALRGDYEGTELSARINLNGGTMTKLIDKVNADGSVTFKPATVITEENGYEIFNSAGLLYSLRFLDTLIKKGYYAAASINEATSHTGAQATFLTSKYNSKTNPIGMLAEGSYWTHESADTFRSMASRYKNSSLAERRLSVMPYPKADESQLGKNTLFSGSAICCINSTLTPGSDMAKLSELFVKYCYTNESLSEFFMTTNVNKPFTYTLSAEQEANLTPYGKSIITLTKNSNCLIGSSNSDFCYRNYTALQPLVAYETSYATDPVTALRAGTSPETIFNAIRSRYTADSWKILTGSNK